MAIVEVKVPQLSESVAEATLLQWKKKPGEAVAIDEIIIEVETDKVVLEVPAPAAGVLVELVMADGSTVVSDQVIARIEPNEYQARVRQAQQQADSAKAQVDIAQRQFDNNQALVNQGFISQTALLNSQASLNGAKATHAAALAALDLA